MLQPLFKWSGGKRREIKHFEKYFPASYKTYLEPFVGGGAVYFHLEPNHAIINDIHPDVTNFYRCIGKGLGWYIASMMDKTDTSEASYYRIRDTLAPQSEEDRAFQFYYLRKTAFRGMIRYNAGGKFNIPWGRYKTIDYSALRNQQYFNLLKRTTVLSSDFEVAMQKCDRKSTFVFLDPPYDSEFSDYGFYGFGKKEHEHLASTFKKSKSKCLMVIGETDFIRNLYDGYIRESYHKNYAFKIYGGRIGQEINNNHLIITNYPNEEIAISEE